MELTHLYISYNPLNNTSCGGEIYRRGISGIIPNTPTTPVNTGGSTQSRWKLLHRRRLPHTNQFSYPQLLWGCLTICFILTTTILSNNHNSLEFTIRVNFSPPDHTITYNNSLFNPTTVIFILEPPVINHSSIFCFFLPVNFTFISLS